MSLLYDAVALGMGAYTRTAFRTRTLGGERFRAAPRTLLAVTHRSETDVPLVCPSLYRYGRLYRERTPRVSFAAREDLFQRGFFAGFPPELPVGVRRALWGVGVSRWLPGVQVHPLRSATRIRLAEVVELVPELELAALPDGTAASLAERARAVGLPEPRRVAEVARGEYADLLWRAYDRSELGGLAEVWAARAAAATRDFRALVELVRGGGCLLVFPEGRPSPDGTVGPLRPGLGALVRRARPERVQAVGIAYDPLGAGRTRAYVSVGPSGAVAAGDVEEDVLRRLRRAVPLTVGQLMAHELADDAPWSFTGLERALRDAVAEAEAEGRHVDPELLDPSARSRRLAEALRAVPAHADRLAFLAREYRTARL